MKKNYHDHRNLGVASETIRLIRFMETMGVNRGYFVLTILLSSVTILFQVLNLQLLMAALRVMITRDYGFVGSVPVLKNIVGPFISGTGQFEAVFLVLVTSIFAVTLAKLTLQYMSDIGVTYLVRRATGSLRSLMFERYLKFGKSFFDKASLGRINTVIMKFSSSTSAQLNNIQKLISQVLSLAAYLGIMLYISWELTSLMLCIFPFFVLLAQWVTASIRNISRAQVKAEEDLDDRIFSVLMAMPLVKAHNMEHWEKSLFQEANREEARLSFRLDRKGRLIPHIQELCMTVAFIALASAVAFLLPSGKGNISSYLVFFYIARLSLPGFNAINQFRVNLNISSARIEKILEVLDDEKKFILSDGTREFTGIGSGIEVRGLDFSYDGRNMVLKGISLVFNKGQMTAIVGATGSGKTTLIHLIMRFYDCPAGTILLDGTDIRDLKIQSLLDKIAYVSQDAFFFNDTIRMNMTYGLDREVSEEELMEASVKARIDMLIKRLPDGFDTVIGERGAQLSGGEKQRLSIARALLRDAEIIILDEATSSLDSSTEKLIQEAISDAVSGRTAIVAAHRFFTIRGADKIVVLEDGTVAEQGALSELLDKKGKFYRYWNEQRFF